MLTHQFMAWNFSCASTVGTSYKIMIIKWYPTYIVTSVTAESLQHPINNTNHWQCKLTCFRGRVVNALGRHVQYSVTRSVARVRLGPGAFVYQRIISNDSYAHDEQGDNPRQVKGFDGVLYKLWPLLMPWLAASRYQSRRGESRSR